MKSARGDAKVSREGEEWDACRRKGGGQPGQKGGRGGKKNPERVGLKETPEGGGGVPG